jgi:uncharacterized protein (TIGR02270 family)
VNDAPSAIVSQFAEEAAFLWLLRDLAVRAPHYLLADLARLDHRIEAHLDGLRESGGDAWMLVKAEAERGDPGAVFAAANLAMQDMNDQRIAFVVELGAANPQAGRGLVSSLGWRSFARVKPLIEKLCASERPELKRIGVAAAAAHRQRPALDLGRAVADPSLLAAVLKAGGELGSLNFATSAREHLAHDDPHVQFRAAWSAALLAGDAAAVAALAKTAEQGGAYAERAAALAARRLDRARAADWLKHLAKSPQTARCAIVVAGALGDPAFVDWLIDQMQHPPLARLAGEAFSLMTGAHLAYDKLEGAKPEGFEAGPSEDPADERVAMDIDEHLAWPNAQAVRQWWDSRRGAIAAGARYILGKPISADWLREVLRCGYQRQRIAAAVELAILEPGAGLFPIAAPGFRQQQLADRLVQSPQR